MTDLEKVKKSFKDNTKLVWIESPTNPMIKLIDLKAMVKITREARGNDCLIAADNTFASPYL